MIRIVSRPVSCLASCVVALAALVVTPGTAAASFVQYSSRATFVRWVVSSRSIGAFSAPRVP